MTLNKNIINTMDELKKDNPFKVPENYLNDFPFKMSLRISKSKKENVILPIFQYKKPKLIPIYIISGIAILAFVSIFLLPDIKQQKLSAAELIELYEYSALNDTPESELINAFSNISNNNEIEKDSTLLQIDNFANEAIDYLNNNNIDVNLIIEAF